MAVQESILNSASDLRGRVIQRMIELEVRIDTIITSYFINDEEKRNELSFVVFGTINASAKVPILEYVLHRNETNTKENILKLLKAIRTAIEERNLFAHWPVHFGQEGQQNFANGQLTFVKLKVGKIQGIPEMSLVRHFKENKANELIKFIESINLTLDNYINGGRGGPLQDYRPEER